jgi:LuxR family maltose regulon positive regulatory protein
MLARVKHHPSGRNPQRADLGAGGRRAANYDPWVFEGSGQTRSVAVVPRRALLSHVEANRELPVVVVHAGAGFGKSTLAAQWAARDPRPHVLVRVAPFLNDPASLALRLIDAMESLGPPVGDLRALATGVEPAFSALLLPSITQLAASRDQPYVLVVDDIHLLTHPDCHAVLAAIADGVPPGSQMALLSRMPPPAWVARARAEGRLLELGPEGLAFDAGEGDHLVEDLLPGIAQAQSRDLVRRAEGWPVGLYLMVLAIQTRGRGGVEHVAASVGGADRFVVDYLRAEVLTGYDDDTRDFLRRTSILEDLQGPLCDAVLERNDSSAVLRHLADRMQLVVALDPAGHHYRYHHLLAHALRADLDGEEPWLAAGLHLRASQWYETHGDLDAAIRHAKAGGDLERAGALVWAGVPSCIASGRPDRLGSWLDDLDDGQVAANRWLSLAAAWLGLQTGDPDRMTRWLLVADEHAGPDWRSAIADDTFAASLGAIHITVWGGNLAEVLELSRAVATGMPPTSGFRVAALLNVGVSLALTRRFHEARASLQEAERLGRALGVPVVEANALAWQGLLGLLADDWASAVPLIERTAELVEVHRLDRLTTSAYSVTVVALLHATQGRREQARTTLATARRLTVDARRIAPWFTVAGPLLQARAAILLGEGALARTLLVEARTHMTRDLSGTVLTDLVADTEAMLRTIQSEGIAASAITAAELRVLQFLPSRLTFQQIGEHLFLSQTTVKTHAMSIYRKLGATSRDDAVSRALALGLVESPPHV